LLYGSYIKGENTATIPGLVPPSKSFLLGINNQAVRITPQVRNTILTIGTQLEIINGTLTNTLTSGQ